MSAVPATSLSTLADAALAYAREGLRVLPLQPRGKAPLTRHGVKDATTNEADIRAWWSRWPDANVGLAMGLQPGGWYLVGIDLDRRDERNGFTAFAALVGGDIPKTRQTETGGGGWHFYFRHVEQLPGSRDKLAAGIEVITSGLLVVAPSVHPSGRPYLSGGCPSIASLPEVLVRAIKSSGQVREPSRDSSPTEKAAYAIDLRAWDEREDVRERFSHLLGIEVGVKFHPSWRERSDEPCAVFDGKSIHDPGGPKRKLPDHLSMPEAFLAHVTAHARKLRRRNGDGTLHVLWNARMLVALGFDLGLPPIDHPPLPPGLSGCAVAVYGGFLLRLHLSPTGHEVAFSDRFAEEWLAVSGQTFTDRQINRAKHELRGTGLIHKSGERASGRGRPTFLYVLGDGTPDTTLGEARP